MTTMKKFALLTAAIALGAAGNAFATQIDWIGGSNASANFGDTTKWNGGVVPTNGDVAYFPNADTVVFVTNIPTTSGPSIRVNNGSASITFQPASLATYSLPSVTVDNGTLTFDTTQQTSISSSISVSSGANLIVKAAMANTGTMSVTGVFDAAANVTNSSNPALTINSGGIMKYRNGADLLGTATLTLNGHFDVIDGQTELSANIAIATTCIGDFRVQLVSSGSPELKLNASYNAPHAFTVRLLDQSSILNVVGTVSTSGDFYSAYDLPCDGVQNGTFSWTGTNGADPDTCN